MGGSRFFITGHSNKKQDKETCIDKEWRTGMEQSVGEMPRSIAVWSPRAFIQISYVYVTYLFILE